MTTDLTGRNKLIITTRSAWKYLWILKSNSDKSSTKCKI